MRALLSHQCLPASTLPRLKSEGVSIVSARESRLALAKMSKPNEERYLEAEQLIDYLSAKRFDPNEYHDEFMGRVQAAIQRKVAGKEVSLAEAPVASTGGNVIDLMAALKASIGAKSANPMVAQRKAPKLAAAAAPRKVAQMIRTCQTLYASQIGLHRISLAAASLVERLPAASVTYRRWRTT
jgi:hypothetical protein